MKEIHLSIFPHDFQITLTSIPCIICQTIALLTLFIVTFFLLFFCNLTALGILVLSGLILLPVLLPVAATDSNVKTQKTNGNQTFSEIDNLLMGNVKVPPRLLLCFSLAWTDMLPFSFCSLKKFVCRMTVQGCGHFCLLPTGFLLLPISCYGRLMCMFLCWEQML